MAHWRQQLSCRPTPEMTLGFELERVLPELGHSHDVRMLPGPVSLFPALALASVLALVQLQELEHELSGRSLVFELAAAVLAAA